jgi:hypothetical protein
VASEREQDKWLERLLRRANDAPVQSASGACLDAETLAAWSDGILAGRALAEAEAHASNCERCLSVLAAVERTTPIVPPSPRRFALRWLVPLAGAATAVALWVAIPGQRVIPVAEEAASVSRPAEPPTPPPMTPVPQGTSPTQMSESVQLQAPSARLEEPKTPPQPLARSNNVKPAENPARADSQQAESRRTFDASAKPEAAAAPATPSAPAALEAPAALQETVTADTSVQSRASALKSPSVIEAVSPNDPLIRWRVVAGANVERSLDGGETWSRTSSPSSAIVGVAVADALGATVTTSDAGAFSTTDGGATWAPVQGNPAPPF